MPDSNHAVLSPSSSHIWLNCPPAARLAAKFQDKETPYAAQGTEAHALAEHKLKLALGWDTEDPRPGMEFLDEEMEECTDDYVSFIQEKIAKAEAERGKPAVFIEQKVDYSRWVPDGFGYADCIIVSESEVSVVDLKFGSGVMVDADHNSQFMLYALSSTTVLHYSISFAVKDALQRLDEFAAILIDQGS